MSAAGSVGVGEHGPEHRFRLCPNEACAATYPVPIAGGTVSCAQCGRPTTIPPRPPLRATATEAGDEARRVDALRRQAANYNPNNKYAYTDNPEGLEHLTGQTSLDILPRALQSYYESWKGLEQGRDKSGNARRLYWVTRLIKNVTSLNDCPHEARGAVHTSLDLLDDPGYRHSLCCILASLARKAGDRDAADRWLDLCDPHPSILDLDTDYRAGRALLRAEAREWDAVLDLVGERRGDIPYEPSSVAVITSLRIAALEARGRSDEADREMRWLLDDSIVPRSFLVKLYRNAPAYDACAAVMARVDQSRRPSAVAAAQAEMETRLAELQAGSSAQAKRKKPSIGWLIPAGVGLLVGVSLVVVGLDELATAKKQLAWKPAAARIVDVTVEMKRKGKKKAKLYVYATYEYEVAGKRYRSNRVRAGKQYYRYSSDKKAAEKRRALLTHRDITIYYDPKNPRNAVHKRESVDVSEVVIGIGVVLLLGAMIFLVVYLVKRRRWSRAGVQA